MKDFIKKTPVELKTLLSEKRLALRNFRFAVSGSNVRNVKEGNSLKKDIARILTILNNKSVK
ncbi:MAG: 50S ribosomal protein L29 [Candidatus Paceibacterota bacterium]|jgi:ribosomal protein L29